MKKHSVLVFAVICYTFSQLKNVECKSYCRFYAGYDTGVYVENINKCFCQDEIDQERLTEKRLILPSKSIKRTEDVEYNPSDIPQSLPEEPKIPFRLPWENE